MPRIARVSPAGFPYHVLNRAHGRQPIFRAEKDFLAFERCIIAAHARHRISILGWCILSNHWHFVVHPEEDDAQLSRFFGYLGLLHATRWQAAHRAIGSGHVYQSRFKHFMIEEDAHLLTVLRYVERNALRARLVRRAERWRWCSLFVRERRDEVPVELRALLSDWPIDRSRDWVERVNRPQTAAEELAVQRAVQRGTPFGSDDWVKRMTKRFDLTSTLRPRGRPLGWRKEKLHAK
jgi:putative transposase